jgi:hypothetical protein
VRGEAVAVSVSVVVGEAVLLLDTLGLAVMLEDREAVPDIDGVNVTEDVMDGEATP